MKIALDIIGVALSLCLIVAALIVFIVLLSSDVFVMLLIVAGATYGIAQLRHSRREP